MHFRPPMGIPYEWVGIADRGKDLGDMGSSDFLGFSPVQWVEVADPEVLRYLYVHTPIFRRIVLDLYRVDAYHDGYDQAEDRFYAGKRDAEEEDQARSYALAQLSQPPEGKPFALSYRHAAFLAQISPQADRVEWCLRRLRDTGILTRRLTDFETDRVRRRLEQGGRWVERYAPENKVVLLEQLPKEVLAQLTPEDRESLGIFAKRVDSTEWREDAIKEGMVTLTEEGNLPVDTPRFFRNLYLVLVGQEKGPRAAPFLSVLDKKFVVARLLEAAG
jgi:lysyl-tRNA synthetase, class I